MSKPKFQARHYEAIAEIIRFATHATNEHGVDYIPTNALLRDLSDMFARDNMKFSRDRFVDAAGGYRLEENT